MFKKISLTLISIITVALFWYILGEVYVLKEKSGGIDKLQCVSYAPFGKDESPFDKKWSLSEELVKKDLALLSKYTNCIRTYSSVGLEIVPKIARENGLKIYMGAWVSADKKLTSKEISTMIKLAKENRDIIKGVIVGNEVLLRGEATQEEMASYIKEVKNALGDIEVTYADVWEFWLKNKALFGVVDFVTIHILPYWEDNPIGVEKAIEHVIKIREEVSGMIGGKKLLIGETGWPSEGRMREDALPSKINQALFIREFIAKVEPKGWEYNIIEAIDQPWKRVSEGAVGGYWGLFDADRGDKFVLKGDMSNFFNYKQLALGTILLFLGFLPLLKNVQDSKKIILFNTVNMFFALLFVLQIEQFRTISKNMTEHILAIFILTTHVAIYYYTLLFITTAKREDRFVVPLFNIIFATLILLAAALAFDGRYRDFKIYAFTISAISYILLFRGRFEEIGYRFYPKTTLSLMAIIAVVTFVHETYLNIYSDIWIAILLSFGYIIYKNYKANLNKS